MTWYNGGRKEKWRPRGHPTAAASPPRNGIFPMDSHQDTLFPEFFKTKTCTKCKVEKPLNEYDKRKDSGDGLRTNCTECRRKEKSQYYQDNRFEILAKEKAQHAENPGPARERAKQWYADNKERAKKRIAEWAKANPERVLAYKKKYTLEKQPAWRKANRDKGLAQQARRRARKASVPTGPKPTLKELLEMQNGKCAYCETKTPSIWHIDHVIPISRGGPDTADNVVAACASCNTSKGSKDVDVWMSEQGLATRRKG